MLAVNGTWVGIIIAGAVIVTVVLWSRSRPPWLMASGFPPVMRRTIWWWLGATCLCVLVAGMWLVLRAPLGLPRDGVYRFVPAAISLGPLLVVNPVYLWRTAWLRRAAATTEGRLCTHCAYDVTGLAPAGTCPECGEAYDVDADKHLWENLRGVRKGEAVERDSRDGGSGGEP